MPLMTNFAIAASLAALVGVAPLALPSRVLVERSATIDASPAEVFALVNSNRGFQQFNPYLDADPDLDIFLSGPEFGPGSAFAFDGRDGKGTQTITSIQQDRQVVMQIDLGARGRPLQTFDLTPTAGGTAVRWSVDSDLGLNPVARIFGLFLEGMVGPTIERGLENLSTAARTAA